MAVATVIRSRSLRIGPGHDRRYAIDPRKLERELGWRLAETFETGIRKTITWISKTRTGSETSPAVPIGNEGSKRPGRS